MNHYVPGELVRCSAAFTTAAGTAVDPSVVTFKFTSPAGIVTTYVYGTDAQLVKDATGNYHVDVDAATPGVWQTRFVGSGAVGQSADQDAFQVDPLNV